MTYLLQYARRPGRGRKREARVDERLRLNLPEFDGGASVRVFVEDTSRKRFRRQRTGRRRVGMEHHPQLGDRFGGG